MGLCGLGGHLRRNPSEHEVKALRVRGRLPEGLRVGVRHEAVLVAEERVSRRKNLPFMTTL